MSNAERAETLIAEEGAARRRRIGSAAVAVVALVALQVALSSVDSFPESWTVGFADWVNSARRWVIDNQTSHWLFSLILNPISDAIDGFLRAVERLLLWFPWFVIVVAGAMVGAAALGRRGALLIGMGMLYFGAVDLWEESVQTFALMIVAVLISLAIGIPVGIWAARIERVEAAIRPLLDGMQTMPAFVYLIPVVLLFGIARVPAIIATVVYALPPAVRLTILGIRSVPQASLDAAVMFGATPRQTLFKVQLPLAKSTILTGVNQTIMMALSIVVIAALIGAGGLGQVVLESLRRLFVGRALEAGLAIVALAIMMDRITFGFAGLSHDERRTLLPTSWQRFGTIGGFERGVDGLTRWTGRLATGLAGGIGRLLSGVGLGRAGRWIEQRPTFTLAAGVLAVATVAGRLTGAVSDPDWLRFSFAGPTDSLVDWVQVNLYEIEGTPIGTGPFSDFITIYAVSPLRELLSTGLAWPVVVAAAAIIGWRLDGVRLAGFAIASLLTIGVLGMWELSMDTLAQVVVAVVLSVAVGIPLGIAAARSDRVERMLKPVLDFLQTIPSFVLLVPVIILFNVGRVPGIIASVLYALPAAVRLTNLGIRQVPASTIEAADMFGATRRQTLRKVQMPLAMPSIIAGVNQTVMLVLAMVVIAGLVGGGGLGLETVRGLRRSDSVGTGFAAGFAIVLLAMLLDRLTQAWARRLTTAPASEG